MAAASLHGSSVPIYARPEDEPYAVMVICPNRGSHERLMQALNNIVPDAFVSTHSPATATVANTAEVSPYMAGFEPNEDGVITPGCATGACGLD